MSLTSESWFCAEAWKKSVFKHHILEHFEVCNMLVVDELIFYFLNSLTFLPLPFFPAEFLSASFFIWKKFFPPLELTAYFIYNQNLFLYITCDLCSAFKQVSLSLESPNLKVIDSSLTFPELFALLKDVF